MKLFHQFILGGCAVATALSFSACDFLDKEPDTELTMDMVYENKTYVEDALAYVYSGLPNPSRGFLLGLGWEVLGDDMTPSKRWQQWDWSQIIPKIFGQWTQNSSWEGGFWHMYPRYIRESYLFRQNVKALPSEDLPQSEVDLMKTECRFLAAYYWWNLAKVYGPIPFKPDYITPSDFNLSDLMVARAPWDSIVNYCDKEMLAAANELPAMYSKPEKYGRINKIMCLAERARMLLFNASPLVNGNSWYMNYTNKDGQHLFPTAYDAKKWVRAVEALKLLIDEAEGAGCKLFVEYNDDGTVDPFKSLTDMFFTKWTAGNKEILFPFTRHSSEDDNFKFYTSKIVPKNNGGGGGLGVYQGLVDAFFTKNGLPITDPNSYYQETGFSNSVETRNTQWDQGTGTPGEITAKGTYNMYCNREPRFYTTVSYNGSWYELEKRPFEFFRGGKENDYTHDAPQNGYLVRKKVYPYDNPRTGNWYTNRPLWLYRLGGAYLAYAEAMNEAYDTPDARETAIEYVNRVRVRAGVRQYTTKQVPANDPSYIHVESSQSSIRNIVRMERRVELCCEGLRWDDIRRWKIAEDLPEMTGDDYGMNYAGENAGDFYKRTVYQTRVWKRSMYWFPIYVDEMEKNPNLVQSPFWN
ncbi:RagB/SusD family nutrient uptake outer membrane protein [Prevotella sp. kh1p2]|uniref:RagB/SusD family nutrient uptake outer membrane protein n=1 Tax=Prevotella sp. kh1p2 TaxID=1761883 RepID=UPI0008BB3CE0|nr:RagB/SusD family nutrient uptake outer membrane protein [Prevotella sp. kh1p2]SES89812.1 Starch-binding associating with outer membrane [Prevotella sp. kh1p2]SNU11621.1 Starch-binding associating with outer membrane [Prevotellaceae bacterium KH2P17]